MPPHSFMEWVVGQNVIPRPRETSQRRPVFALELETDDEAESDTLKVTYPRTGRSSSRRSTQPKVKKSVRFIEDGYKTEVKKTEVQVRPLPKPDTGTSTITIAGTSGGQESTEEEVIIDCPCANCIEAHKKLKAKEAESSSCSSKNSAATVHARHKAKVAKKTEPAKRKSSTKKQKPKTKAKKRKEKSGSEAETTEATTTESETEADTETETEVETEEDTGVETESESESEEEIPKKKGGKKGKDNKKPEKAVKKSQQDKKGGQNKKGETDSTKSQKQDDKEDDKSKKETSSVDDDVLAFQIAMSYNRRKQREREERMKAKAKEEKAKEEKAKEEKAKAKAKARAKAKAEAEAEKSLPPHNPGLENRRVSFLLPSQSRVLHVEHAVEEPSDPYPNAFYDNRNGIMRVYHGPSYGNPNTVLYPQKIYSNQPLPIGTPHPLENPYYNGFQTTADRGQASVHAPYTYQPRQHSPPSAPPDPPQARRWFQGVGSVPVGKPADYEKDIDLENYERELQRAYSPISQSAKETKTLKNSDRGGRSNVAPATKANDKKPSDIQSVHGSQKGSGSRDGKQNGGKGGTGKEKGEPAREWLRKTKEKEIEEMGWGEAPGNTTNPNTNDNHSHRSGSNKGSQNNDWGAGNPPANSAVLDWVSGNNIPPTGGKSNSSVKNGSSNSRKSSNASKASSTRSKQKHSVPGGWVSSPTKSDRSTRSRPPGTIPDNVGPDLTSSKMMTGGKVNNNVDEKADEWGEGVKHKNQKNKGGPDWGDTGVAQTSGGVFDEENNNEGEWNGEGGQGVKGELKW